MKNKPILLILAAGLGARYGSLKQIDRIGPSGERIIDYSVYDAVKAGFGKIVYVIRKSFEEEFIEVILNELPPEIETDYVCQEVDSISSEYSFNQQRTKPWGTGHALLTASLAIDGSFAVINADDFYGADSFKRAIEFLNALDHNSNNEYALIEIKKTDTGIIYKDENEQFNSLSGNEIVSMNMFALTSSIFKHYQNYFNDFLQENANDLKNEFYLPTVINNLVKSKEAKVKVIETNDSWFGLTYLEDKKIAKNKIMKLVNSKNYPPKLWNN
jgi:choline kinase